MKAVVFVDVQKDFIDGALKNDKAMEVTPKIVEFAKDCVKNGYKLYATRDTHEKSHYKEFNCEDVGIEPRVNELTGEKYTTCKRLFGYGSTLEGIKLPIDHCIEGTDGWMIDERLWNEIEGKVTVVNKPTFGSFDLAEIIQEDVNAWDDKNYFDEIIICGFVTSICILANAILLRAKFPNTKITVIKDLCCDVNEENHEAALKCLESQMIEVK